MLVVRFDFLNIIFSRHTIPEGWVPFVDGVLPRSGLRLNYLWKELFEEIKSIIVLLVIQIKGLCIHLI